MNSWDVSHQKVWQLAWPMIISNLSTPLLGLVDTAILGHLDDAKFLAAVALGAALVTFILWSFGFLRMGTTSLVARAVGAGDQDRVHQTLWRSVEIALLLSVILYGLQWWLLPSLLAMVADPTTVRDLAQNYCQIRMLAAPATLFNYVLVGWFVGCQNTRIPLLLMLVLNSANIVFDVVLVWWLDLGSDGAAWASVAAEYLSAAVGLTVLARWGVFSATKVAQPPRRWQQLTELFAVNGHLFVRTAALLSVTLFFTVQGNTLGATVVAANAILLQLVGIISYGLDGYAHAAEALVGRATGAANRGLFIKAFKYTALWSGFTALAMSALLYLLGGNTVLWFTDIAEVANMAQQHYVWLVVFPLASAPAYHLDGVFLGWGRADAMQITMLMSALLVFFPLWWALSDWGNMGLWAAFTAFNASRGVLLVLFFAFSVKKGNLSA